MKGNNKGRKINTQIIWVIEKPRLNVLKERIGNKLEYKNDGV